MTAPPIRVLLADDHPIVLAGIRALIAAESDMVIIGEAANGLRALSLAETLTPDIAIFDMSMPNLNGINVARRLREGGFRCKIIALTVHEEPAYIRQLMELGMGGYVLKRSAADDLVRAIRIVRNGGVYIDPVIAGQIVGTSVRRAQDPSAPDNTMLSEREGDVLRLTALGYSNKAIAAELGVGIKTVETYKTRAMEKLGFRSRVDVIRYAVNKGWLTDA